MNFRNNRGIRGIRGATVLPVLFDLTSFLLGPLKAIWDKILCILTAIAEYFLLGIVSAINLLFGGVGDLISAAFSALPDMPSPPDWGDTMAGDIVSAINWFFPVGFLVTMIGVLITLWVSWQLISIALRWGRVIGGAS